MPSNRSDQEKTIRSKFNDYGGHVNICSNEWPLSVTADADGATQVPDIIRWVLEHKGLAIVSGDVQVGHFTVNNWRDSPLGDIPLPNTYVGFAGWRPAGRLNEPESDTAREIRIIGTGVDGQMYEVVVKRIYSERTS